MHELVEWVHHHLKTPLAALLGHADLLNENLHDLPPHARSSVEGIMRAGGRLDEVVAAVCELVDIACVSTSSTGSVDVSMIVADAASAHRELAARRGVRVRHTGGAAAVCTADPTHLGRALGALLEHSITGAEPGSEVHVTTTRAGTGARVVLRCRPSVAQPAGEQVTGQRPDERMGPRGPVVGARFEVALASAVARACGGRLDVSRTPSHVVVQLDLPHDPRATAEVSAPPRG